MNFYIPPYKFSHFAYSPDASRNNGGFRYDIPVFIRKHRHAVMP